MIVKIHCKYCGAMEFPKVFGSSPFPTGTLPSGKETIHFVNINVSAYCRNHLKRTSPIPNRSSLRRTLYTALPSAITLRGFSW